MADESDVIRIDLDSDVSGGEAAKQKLQEVGQKVDELQPAFARARDASGRFVAGIGQDSAKAGAAITSVGSSAATATYAVATATNEVGAAFSVNGNKLQVFAQGLDDLQYVPEQGLRPILNNLIQISPVLGIVALGVSVVYSHFEDLAGLFGQGATRTEAEEMEALGKATKRTADEEERYQKLKQREKHAEAQHAEPEEVSAYKKHVDEAIANGPAVEIEKGVDKLFRGRIEAMADSRPDLAPKPLAAESTYDEQMAHGRALVEQKKAQKERDDARAMIAQYEEDPFHRSQYYPQYVAAKQLLNSTYNDSRKRFMADLGNNPGTVGEIQKAAEANPGDFGKDGKKFAGSLKEAAKTPADKKEEEEDRKAQEHLEKTEREFEDRKAKAEVEAAHDADKKESAREKLYQDMDDENYKDALAEAKRSKSYLDKPEGELSLAEKAAKGEADEAAATRKRDKERFNGRVDKERQGQTYLGIDEEDLTEEQRRAKQLDARAKKDAIDKAEKVTSGTGLDRRGEDAMLRAAFTTRGDGNAMIGAVQKQLEAEFKRGGMGDKEAQTAAHEKAKELHGKVMGDASERAMAGPRMDPISGVQRIGVGDFARSVESSEMKKMVSLTEEMKAKLADIVRNTAGPARLGAIIAAVSIILSHAALR
jgi:hypothetical protein